MNVKGLRIFDINDGKCIPLLTILANFSQENVLHWALLWLDVTPVSTEGSLIMDLQRQINTSKKGVIGTFEYLNQVSRKIFQEIDVLIIGCSNEKHIHRYAQDQEMYETCDVVIEMIDGGFWEIFAKNAHCIDQLAKQYTRVEFLASDFQNE